MRITLLAFFSFSFITLYSQQNSLLKNFKYRVDRYQVITLNMGSSGQFDNVFYDSGAEEGKGFGGNLSGNYSLTRSTDKILLNLTGGLYAYYDRAINDNPGNDNKYKTGYIGPSLSVLNKWFGNKTFFIELGTDISAGFGSSKSNTANSGTDNESRSKQNIYSVNFTAGIGKGRLENIMDMQNALWLNKALQGEKKLTRSLSDAELNGLGRTITKANNTRILDSRKRIQFILETTDGFLRDNNLVSDCDIRYFSTLNDILFFAVNNPRFSGTEIYLRLTPAWQQQFDNSINKSLSAENENAGTRKSARLAAGVKRYIPLNLKHQNNYGGSVFADYWSLNRVNKDFVSGSIVSRSEMNSTLKQAGLNAFFQHSIYPNTRTIINFDLSGETGYEYLEDGDESFFGTGSLNCSLDYFISYRTRLTATLGVSYQKNIYDKYYYLTLRPERLLLNASIGLVVNI